MIATNARNYCIICLTENVKEAESSFIRTNIIWSEGVHPVPKASFKEARSIKRISDWIRNFEVKGKLTTKSEYV